MLSHQERQALEHQRTLLANAILHRDSKPEWRYARDTQMRQRQGLKDLQELDAVLAGHGAVSGDISAVIAARHRAYSDAFLDWMRNGPQMSQRSRDNLKESRATIATEGTPLQAAYPGATSGYFVPMDFWREVVSAAKSVGPFWDDNFCTMHITETGAPLPIPSDDDIGTSAAILNEGGQFSSQTLATTKNVLGTYKFNTALLVSDEYVQDSGIPLDSYLAKRFGVRCMRGLLPFLTAGTGSGQPAGVLNGLTASVTAVGAENNDGVSAANTIGSDDLANLELALDPAFRPNAKWMMHGNTLAALRRVKDKNGRPVHGSLNRPDPVLLSYPVTINNAMAQLQTAPSTPAVTNVTVALGAFDRFHVRVVRPILMRLTERYAEYGQTMFALHYRADAVLVDPTAGSLSPVVTLQNTY